jgi:hypothetical protein
VKVQQSGRYLRKYKVSVDGWLEEKKHSPLMTIHLDEISKLLRPSFSKLSRPAEGFFGA